MYSQFNGEFSFSPLAGISLVESAWLMKNTMKRKSSFSPLAGISLVERILDGVGIVPPANVSVPLRGLVWGESSEAAISRHATAENVAQRGFQKNFQLFPGK